METSPLASSRVLVVGATSSMTQTICRALARRTCAMTLVARDAEELGILAADIHARYSVTCMALSVDMLAADFSADQLIEQVGDFDHMLVSIGDMSGEDKDDPVNLYYTTHINYTLPAQLASTAALKLKDKGAGSVTIISSVAGDRGRQSNYTYGAAKAALTAFASGLRNRYAKEGVHVMTVKPGFVDTPMTWGMKSPLIASREYVAEKIVTAMEKKKDVIYVPFFWRFIMLIIRHIPEKIFKRLSL